MISALIILSLLSLLVATEPEANGAMAHPEPKPPLRPLRKAPPAAPAKPDRLAA
jgi:hypothetical protein